MPFDAIKYRQARSIKSQVARKPRRKRRWFLTVVVLLIIIGLAVIGSRLKTLGEKIFGSQTFSFGRLFLSSDKKLVGEEDGEIRLLLFGIAGGNHDGANLADTMILATVRPPKTDDEHVEVALFSIPRDLAVNIPGFDIKKINSAYACGEAGDSHLGPELAVRTVEGFLNTTIPYYAVVDFQGYKQAVDHVGGIEVNVEAGFTDAQFPDEKNGYLPPLVFEAGLENMGGARALQYVRSRHGNNNQGSDFARSRRQQIVLKAFQEKVLDLGTLTNLKVLSNLLSDFADHFRTNLEPTELRRLYNLTREIRNEDVLSQTLDGRTGLICDYIAPEDGQYLLIHCAGFNDFTAIRAFWRNQFVSARLAQENPTIEIQNTVRGEPLAQYTASLLGPIILDLTLGNFSGETAYTESIIYDNTGGKKKPSILFTFT